MIKLAVKAQWQKLSVPIAGDWYRWGDTRVYITKDAGLWHLSISCENRYPSWNEIYAAWYDLVPDAAHITGAILLPSQAEYVNLYENCFHVYQLADSEVPYHALPGRVLG